jgi:hypothetical protein
MLQPLKRLPHSGLPALVARADSVNRRRLAKMQVALEGPLHRVLLVLLPLQVSGNLLHWVHLRLLVPPLQWEGVHLGRLLLREADSALLLRQGQPLDLGVVEGLGRRLRLLPGQDLDLRHHLASDLWQIRLQVEEVLEVVQQVLEVLAALVLLHLVQPVGKIQSSAPPLRMKNILN